MIDDDDDIRLKSYLQQSPKRVGKLADSYQDFVKDSPFFAPI